MTTRTRRPAIVATCVLGVVAICAVLAGRLWSSADLAGVAQPAERGLDDRTDAAEELLYTHLIDSQADVSDARRASLLVGRARARMRRSLLSEALADLDAAVAADPANVAAWHERAGLHTRQGRHALALSDVERARELDPTDPLLMNDHAATLMDLGRFDDACPILEAALASGFEDWRLRFNRGRVHEELAELDEARVEFERAVALDASRGDAHLHLGRVHRKAGDHEGALAVLSGGARAAPAHAPLRVELAAALLRADRLNECLAECDAAIALDDSLWFAHFARGACLELSGDTESAMAALERSLELNPDWVASMVKLANLRDLAGDAASAQELMRRAAASPEACEQALSRYPGSRRERLLSISR